MDKQSALEHRLWKLTWPEIKDKIAQTTNVIIPVGSMEQHGPHLPIDNDAYTSLKLAERTAIQAAMDGVQIMVSPPIPFGVSWYHREFPGTISLSSKLFIDLVVEVCGGLLGTGFKNLLLLNGHGGNSSALGVAMDIIYDRHGVRVYHARLSELAPDLINPIESPLIHAEEIETSVALALDQRVQMKRATRDAFYRREAIEKNLKQKTSSLVKYDKHHKGPFVTLPMDRIIDISPSGVVGDATQATREKGEAIVEKVTSRLVQLFKELGDR